MGNSNSLSDDINLIASYKKCNKPEKYFKFIKNKRKEMLNYCKFYDCTYLYKHINEIDDDNFLEILKEIGRIRKDNFEMVNSNYKVKYPDEPISFDKNILDLETITNKLPDLIKKKCLSKNEYGFYRKEVYCDKFEISTRKVREKLKKINENDLIKRNLMDSIDYLVKRKLNELESDIYDKYIRIIVSMSNFVKPKILYPEVIKKEEIINLENINNYIIANYAIVFEDMIRIKRKKDGKYIYFYIDFTIKNIFVELSGFTIYKTELLSGELKNNNNFTEKTKYRVEITRELLQKYLKF